MNNKAVNILLLVISQAVNVVILFIFTPYLVRALPKHVYGSYSQVIFVTEFISILFSLAILQVAMMIFSNTVNKLNDSLNTVIRFTFFAGLTAMAVSFLFSFIAPHLFENEMLGPLLKIFSISLIGSKLNLVLNQALIRIEKTKSLMLLSILSNFIKLVLAVIAIRVYDSIEAMLLVYAIEPIMSSITQLFILKSNGYLKGKYNPTILKEIFQVGFPLYIVEILGASYTYIAGFIISINLNEEQYAIYRNGSIELPVIGTIYGTISLMFMSDMLQNIQEKKYNLVAQTKKKIISSTAVILFPIAIFFIFYSKEFIVLYMSEKYVDSYKVFLIFSAALLIRTQNYTDILILMKKSKYILISFLVFVVSNVLLNLVLSNLFGIIGCAFATIFSVYILAFLQMHITIRQLALNYADYIDFKLLLIILISSTTIIGIAKLSTSFFNLPYLVAFISAGAITIPLLIIFYIKNKFIDITPFEKIFNKIPIVGSKIYSVLK